MRSQTVHHAGKALSSKSALEMNTGHKRHAVYAAVYAPFRFKCDTPAGAGSGTENAGQGIP